SNRIIMAPMTRCRAGGEVYDVPQQVSATYYAQRAGAGLIISEGSQISQQGVGYPATPGIHSAEQVEGWKLVTDAVHKKAGKIFLQLWHVGRISHPDYHNGELPVAPSAIKPAGEATTFSGMQPFVTPHALEIDEIRAVVEDFRNAATKAKQAGFDGVEIHGANGYLIDQFIRSGTNQRTDEYGGSLENRARFLLEVAEAVVSVWGAGRVGVRLSPSGTFNDMSDSSPEETFSYMAGQLNRFGLAYLHVVNALSGDIRHGADVVPLSLLRDAWSGLLITNGEYDKERANVEISAGLADAVSFASSFLANPDLPERFSADADLNIPDFDTFYVGGENGYTDYPTMEAA
ncbi:MAG: alkene reductase, partial [Mariprofundaceae bacterium]